MFIIYLLDFISSLSSSISTVRVEYESDCLVLLAGNLLSTWFFKNEKFASNFFDSFLFLLRALDFLSKKGIFPLWAIQFLFKTTSFKPTLLRSYCWDFLIDTWVNLDETILICTFFCCSFIPCSLY